MIASHPLRQIRAFGWNELLIAASVANLIRLSTLIVTKFDLLAIGLTVAVLVGLALRHFGFPRLGSLVLIVTFIDHSFFTVIGATVNALDGLGPRAVVEPAFGGLAAIAGLIAIVGTLIRPRQPYAGQRIAPLVAQLMVVLFFGLLVVSQVRANQLPAAPPSDLFLTTDEMAYSQSEIVIDSGRVTLQLNNEDFFWHTFTVDELDVDLTVTENGVRQTTFNAKPGTYEFYCAIPGHALLGMTGTLTVRDRSE